MSCPVSLRPHQQRGLNAMSKYSRGQIICPTGAGKTLIGIMDALREFETKQSQTIVVVSPRLLLSNQLCEEYLQVIKRKDVHVMHVHSGDTDHFSTTNVEKIRLFNSVVKTCGEHQLIFTTYHSLHRIQESGIEVNTIYSDEAHNSVKRNFFPSIEHFSQECDRSFFFTATRKTSVTINKPGMNDTEVYGDIICKVTAPELVDGGFILPPKVKVLEMEVLHKSEITPQTDSSNVIQSIDEIGIKKIMVCARTTKQLISIFQTDFVQELKERGYSYLYITAKTGAVVDGKKVNRQEFFNTLNSWGKDPNKKFVVLHRSILSEGISISQLEGVIFMRDMDVIELTQTIGRVLRLSPETGKTFGLCVVPTYSKVGQGAAKSLQKVVDLVFNKGEVVDSVVRR